VKAVIAIGVLAFAYVGMLLWLARPLPDTSVNRAAGSQVAAAALHGPAEVQAKPPAAKDLTAVELSRPPAAPAASPAAQPPGGDPELRHVPSAHAPTYRDPFGNERLVPNHTPGESAARESARRRAIEAIRSDAQRDPHAFAARYHLETEDVLAMLEGTRPFPDSLLSIRVEP